MSLILTLTAIVTTLLAYHLGRARGRDEGYDQAWQNNVPHRDRLIGLLLRRIDKLKAERFGAEQQTEWWQRGERPPWERL